MPRKMMVNTNSTKPKKKDDDIDLKNNTLFYCKNSDGKKFGNDSKIWDSNQDIKWGGRNSSKAEKKPTEDCNCMKITKIPYEIGKKFKDINWLDYDQEWKENCDWDLTDAKKASDANLKPKITKALNALKDGVSHKGYDGEYDFEDENRRRLGIIGKPKMGNANFADEKNGIAFGANYWTRLAARASGLRNGLDAETRLRSSMGGMKNAYPLPRRLEADFAKNKTRKLHFDQNAKKNQYENVQEITQVKLDKIGKVSQKNSANSKHSDIIQVENLSPDGLTHSRTTKADLVQNTSVTQQISEQKAVHYSKASKIAEVGEDSETHRRLGKNGLKIEQDDGLEYDMSKIFGSGKFVVPKVKEKEIDSLSTGDSAKLLADSLSLAKEDVASYGGLVGIGWGVLAMVLVGLL